MMPKQARYVTFAPNEGRYSIFAYSREHVSTVHFDGSMAVPLNVIAMMAA
jgi:hypothetical protein